MFRIEEVYSITKRFEYSDGQKVFFFDKNMKEEISRAKYYISINREKSTMHLFNNQIDFMINHDGFAEIFRPLLWGQEEMWMPCLVYYFQDDWYVVSIQNVYCKECGWKGKIACPTVDDAFVGLKNKQDRIKNVFKLHFFDCPECGGRLSSNAIWIESK